MIVYDEFAAGVRAKKALDWIAAAVGNNPLLTPQLISFAALEAPELRECAAQTAAQAQIVLLSTTQSQGLPRHVQTWFDMWIETRSPDLAALAALVRVHSKSDNNPLLQQLMNYARLGRMDLFYQEYTSDRKSPEQPPMAFPLKSCSADNQQRIEMSRPSADA